MFTFTNTSTDNLLVDTHILAQNCSKSTQVPSFAVDNKQITTLVHVPQFKTLVVPCKMGLGILSCQIMCSRIMLMITENGPWIDLALLAFCRTLSEVV